MSKMPERKGLGRGLSALLPAKPAPPDPLPSPRDQDPQPLSVPIEAIDASPFQPRNVFDHQRLEELAQSIRENGVIQPLIVRKAGEKYVLIAGERRWRASKLAGLTHVPVVVQSIPEERLLEVALIENIQREDLNPMELAEAFDRLSRELGLSHEEIGKRTGKDRATISNLVRLLRLPAEVQTLVAEHRLSMGHARAILAVSSPEDQIELANRAAAQGLSVRQVEQYAAAAAKSRDGKPSPGQGAAPDDRPDPNVQAAVEEMQRALGTRVRIIGTTPGRGRVEIEYYSPEDLDRVYQRIVG